jgi:hypothetical protein
MTCQAKIMKKLKKEEIKNNNGTNMAIFPSTHDRS